MENEANTSVSVVEMEPKSEHKTKRMPQYKVLLLNDDVNEFGAVVNAVKELTPLDGDEAISRVNEAHKTGVALLLMTHKERAELYQEQFHAHIPPIKVEIEPDEA